MKLRLYKTAGLLLFILLYVSYLPISAQQIKLVSGRVVNKEDNKPFTNDAVFVYGFNTVAEAEDAQKEIDNQTGKMMEGSYELVDQTGYYEIRVPDNGALVFKVGLAPSVLEKVNNRMEINVPIDAGIVLETVDVVGTLQDIKPQPKAPTMIGNKLLLYNTFPVPAQFGKTNGRLIMQPFILDCVSGDTVAYTRPMIYDGEQYHMTQERRMGYDLSHDPLNKFVNAKRLTEEKMSIDWADTVAIPDPTKNYRAMAAIQLEDYTQVYYQKFYLVNTCETKRPLKFLEYSLDQYGLDSNKYRLRAKREKRNTAGNISLTFLVGKAELDPENPDNEIQMSKLKNDLLEIVNGEGTTLKEFHITGVSSPEGSYASNLALAQKRVAFAQTQITSVLSKSVLSRVYQNPHAEVAPWSDVADLLEADSLTVQAAEIRSIITNQKSPDAQFMKISRLPYYTSVIKEYLPKLRTVHYEYKHEIFRELTPEEIYDRYLHDNDYKTGKKKFALYEYWHLFNMEKDPLKLEKLYKMAYEESKEVLNGQPWILAANNLAVSYLKRDTFDVSILAPFIDRKTRGSNIVRKRIDGVTEETINPEAVVANQLSMYLKANNFEEASVMAQILPDTPQNEKLKAFALCLGGYYRGGNTPEEKAQSKKVFNLVKDSSPINEVIMYLALESKAGDVMAERAAQELSKDSPVAWYLKAIINNRKGDVGLEDAKNCLIQCYKIDEKYIPISESDGDIGKDLYEYAMDMYQLEKEMMNY